MSVQSQRVTLSTGLHMHYAELKPPNSVPSERRKLVLCIHGFPDCWYGYRKLLQYLEENELQNQGLHFVVPDQRGFGESLLLPDIRKNSPSYCMENIVQDNLALMKHLGYDKAVFFGHDWGGTAVWNLAAHFPAKVESIIAVCTPFFPVPEKNPWLKFEKMLNDPNYDASKNRYDYQLYFQKDEAVQDLNENIRLSVKMLLSNREFLMRKPTENGFFRSLTQSELSALEDETSSLLTEEELQYYTKAFSKQGFFGPLSWYRNVGSNWKWNQKIRGEKILGTIPCLMITAEKDTALPPSMVESLKMRENVPNLEVYNIPAVGHWIMQEAAPEVGKIVSAFLKSKVTASKL